LTLPLAVSKRDLIARLFFAGIACVLAGVATPPATASGLPFSRAAAPPGVRGALTFAERVGYQNAIEEIYWRHRIWPKENPGPKPPVDAVISREEIEKKVTDYLRKSQFVTDQRGSPITPSELQAEMDRIAHHTKRPEMLRELFEALGNDPFVIAECLARPILAERLVSELMTDTKETSFRAKSRNPAAWLMGDSTGSFDFAQDDIAANLDKRGYKLPDISLATDCADDTWTATSVVNAPDARDGHTAVWTGGEMIVWGGFNFSEGNLNTGGRYDPGTDTWTATSATDAPIARWLHTVVWTGSEVVVWGGYGTDFFSTGGRYNPTNDSWVATSTTNAPEARVHHTAVWTGSEMIVWGGYNYTNLRMNSGGRYNPATDSWIATSITNAPEARWDHNAHWTGSEMIVWGGTNQTIYLKTGAKYNPTENSWTPTTTADAPLGRIGHAAIWSGGEMMVWGGTDSTFNDTNTGGRYNPTANSWSATSTNNAPSRRDSLAAVWTGSEMIVWGGVFCCPGMEFNTGGRYNAGSDSWTPTSTANAPFPRYSLQQLNFAVWTGSEMIVWGGYNNTYQLFFNTGGRYCAQSASTITLSAKGRKVAGINTVRLSWSGASASDIDIYRDSVLIVTTANDGSHTDSTGDTGRARYTYRVCEAGGSTCSNNARVTFRQ
jgi:N-acetylneuraminic acid mutarotase